MTKQIALIHGEANTAKEAKRPFNSPSLNESYSNFLQLGSNYGVLISITSSAFVDVNRQETYGWTYDKSTSDWISGENKPDLFYDRFRFENASEQEDLLRKSLNDSEKCVNAVALEDICKDKYKTWLTFPQYCIPTFLVEGKTPLAKIIEELKKYSSSDLSLDRVIAKNRYGSGGEGISLDTPIGDINSDKSDRLIQPYLDTGRGISELGISRRHDLRVIMVNGKPIVAEARVVHESNQGQELFFPKSYSSDTLPMEIEQIPSSFIEIAKKIDAKLAGYNTRIYSIDFGQGYSGKPWVFELNSRAQQTWRVRSQETLGDNEGLINCRKRQQEAIVRVLAERAYDS